MENEVVKKANMRKHLMVLGVFILITIGVKIWQYRSPEEHNVTLKGEPLRVLIADTPLLRFKGLGGRESLGEYDGMLFLFPESARHGIVMRDMLFSIDVVWFSEGNVIDVAQRLPLATNVPEDQMRGYFPRVDADMVLELPAGWAADRELKIGDRLTLP